MGRGRDHNGKELVMSSHNCYRIVVGMDFSDTADQALHEALRLAERQAPAELHLAAVIDSDHADLIPKAERHTSLVQIADDMRDRLAKRAHGALAPLKARRPEAAPPTVAHVRVGPIAEQLAALATELEADLVVVGTHGRRGVRRLVMGSVAEKTVRLAPCPVLVVRPRDFSALAGMPAIEPACPDCVTAREKTQGASWWCEVHLREPEPLHLYSRSHRVDQVPAVAGTLRF
jgi:nucleotide-binding universal stress UspA family protein